ncbi:MAG: HDOD domain-containing protein [Desulfatiglans sp.]|jgi:EAL and modified HD-GYP domain-containing signal transduction protein|nr:HDOD domain-containing protein [Desulfatiglans sp.]
MAEKKRDGAGSITISIARQPVFNTKKDLWGYELVCVCNSTDIGETISIEDNVAVNVASSNYIGIQQVVERGKRIIVNFNEKNVLDDSPYALPPKLAVVRVPEKMLVNSEVVDSLLRFKKDGYHIAIGGFTGASGYEKLFSETDLLCVDTSEIKKDELKELVQKGNEYDAMILAENIKNSDRFDMCLETGCSLFHGPFFKIPEKLSVRKISSNEISRFNLLKIIEQEDPDYNELAKLIQSDVSISFRLLSYLNSAAFGFTQKIQSIHKAITLLGWKQMKTWLRVVILSDMNQSPNAPELMFVSAQRGKFLEIITREHDFWGFDPDSLFLLGTFSIIDTMLNMEMKEVVKYLPLDDKLKAALCHDPNNEYLPLLQLAMRMEESGWDEANAMIRNLSLDPIKIRKAFQDSIDWANEITMVPEK